MEEPSALQHLKPWRVHTHLRQNHRMIESEKKKKNEVEFSTGPDVQGNKGRMRHSHSHTPGFETQDQSTLYSLHEFNEIKNMVHISYLPEKTPT